MKKSIIVITLCSLLLLTGCSNTPKLKDGKEIVAQIDGFEVTAEDFYEALKKDSGVSVLLNKIDEYISNKEITDNKGAEEYADAQITLTKESYTQNGEDFYSALINAGFANEQVYKELLVNSYKKNKVFENYLKSQFTDKEIEKYYNDEIVGEQSVRHILIIPDVKDTMTEEEQTKAKDKALAKAKDLIKQLDDGADIVKLAKENSDDTGTATNGGLFANFTSEGVDSAFYAASKALKVNEYTKTPVESQYGYHVILKTEEKEKAPLKEVKDHIIETLLEKKVTEINTDQTGKLYQKTFAEIRKKYNLNINDSTMKTLYQANIG